MIDAINNFVKYQKEILDNHINIYVNEDQKLRKLESDDIDTESILKVYNKLDNTYMRSVTKRAYDLIKAKQRMKKIYDQSREQYYKFAELDLKKDKIILDLIVNNLTRVYKILNQEFNVSG